ncbi:MAG: LacI family transcriptional regulator [Verrucomicrobiales bacterium]|jgi:LacI family transcriptional regulator|nr:LacI family transcriptional regulator [Verrucomicrobiales bacterium]
MSLKRVTLSELALAAKVSKNTVSLALRGSSRLPASRRREIQQLARRMGYRKNPLMAHLMAELRGSRSITFQATLGLLNANLAENAFVRHPTIPAYIEGCHRQAEELGYRFDKFWLHDSKLDGERLGRIFRARNIRGAVVVGLMNENHLPEGFQQIWENFPCVVTGVRTREPALSFACVDHHMLVIQAFENARRLGYKRPGLVLDPVIDHLVEGRFSSGYFIAQQAVNVSERLRPFYKIAAARRDLDFFKHWLDKERPDVILTLYNVVADWLSALKLGVPADIGLVQLEWRKSSPDWAGMNQHNDIVGEAAVDMLVGMIHRNESGIPQFPRAMLIGSSWVTGKTVREKI